VEKIKLIIADDQVLFLKGLRLLINTFDTVSLVAEAKNGQELLEAIPIHSPDVVLIDLKMPVMDGIVATKRIREEYPDLKIILLSMHNDESIISHVMRLGANGYLVKNEDPEVLRAAIETVMEKGFYFNDYVSKALLKGPQHSSKKANSLADLQKLDISKREIEILQLICQQYTSTEIGQKLFISTRTVEGHRKRLLDKTGVRNIAGLIIYAMKNQLVEI